MFGWIMAFAALIAVLGVTSLTEATFGVGGIAIGCYLAICGRLVQSRRQHAQLLRALAVSSAEAVQAPSLAAVPNTGLGAATFGGEIQTEVQAYANR